MNAPRAASDAQPSAKVGTVLQGPTLSTDAVAISGAMCGSCRVADWGGAVSAAEWGRNGAWPGKRANRFRDTFDASREPRDDD